MGTIKKQHWFRICQAKCKHPNTAIISAAFCCPSQGHTKDERCGFCGWSFSYNTATTLPLLPSISLLTVAHLRRERKGRTNGRQTKEPITYLCQLTSIASPLRIYSTFGQRYRGVLFASAVLRAITNRKQFSPTRRAISHLDRIL